MQNSQKMTLEERIVQSLKDDTLMKLVGDEDAITELVRRALVESLFKDREVIGPHSWNTQKLSSPAVAAASSAAEKICNKIVDDLLSDPEIYKTLKNAMIDMLPKAIEYRLHRMVDSIVDKANADSVATIRQLKSSGQL